MLSYIRIIQSKSDFKLDENNNLATITLKLKGGVVPICRSISRVKTSLFKKIFDHEI